MFYKPPTTARVFLAALFAPLIVAVCAFFLLYIGTSLYVFSHADPSLIKKLSFTDMFLSGFSFFFVTFFNIHLGFLFGLVALTLVLLPIFIRERERHGARSLRDYLGRGMFYVFWGAFGGAVIEGGVQKSINEAIGFFIWGITFFGTVALTVLAVAWTILFFGKKCSTLEKSELEHDQPR